MSILSNRVLSETETKVLSKGLKYGIKNKRVDTYELLSRFEELAQSLNNKKIVEKSDEFKANLNSKNAFFQQLQNMSTEFIELSKKATDNLTEEELEALNNLSKDKSIVITKADKGNAVVIQNVSDYKLKVYKVLEEPGKFMKLDCDDTLTRELKLQNLLRRMNAKRKWVRDGRINRGSRPGWKRVEKKVRLSDEVYKKIVPWGSKAGVLYGLPKLHKEAAPIRPIIYAVGTYNYKLAKYLDSILKPLLDENEHIIKDRFDFVNKVAGLNLNDHLYMCSFDVVSLFTCIPTLETI
jgi:hypothetical protein